MGPDAVPVYTTSSAPLDGPPAPAGPLGGLRTAAGHGPLGLPLGFGGWSVLVGGFGRPRVERQVHQRGERSDSFGHHPAEHGHRLGVEFSPLRVVGCFLRVVVYGEALRSTRRCGHENFLHLSSLLAVDPAHHSADANAVTGCGIEVGRDAFACLGVPVVGVGEAVTRRLD